MKIKGSHEKIYEALKKRPMSKDELVESTGLSYDGIRGRMSEMRKLGFDIQLTEITEKKYVMVSDFLTSNKNKLLTYLKEAKLFDAPIDIDNTAKKIGLTFNDVVNIVSELFNDKEFSVVQLSNTKVKVMKRNNQSM